MQIFMVFFFRDRRRKNRTKAKAKPTTGNVSLSDALAEKLRLALEKCEGEKK